MNEQKLDQKKLEQQQREERLEQVKTLETWGSAQGTELQQQKHEFSKTVLVFQTKYDEDMIEQMKANAPHVQVNAAAQVPQPPVQAPAPQEGYKARREREKKRREARKLCPVGDEYTLDMARDIKQDNMSRNLGLSSELAEQANANNCDSRVLRVFSENFKLDKRGRPSTEEDQQVLLANRQFISDYTSGNTELRQPHLESITQKILAIQLTPDMMRPENLVKHAAEYKHLGDMFTYFENLQKENPEFFEALPQLQKNLLSSQIELGVAFTAALAQHLNARGIDFNAGDVYESIDPIEMGEAMKGMFTDNYNLALKTSQIRTSTAYQEEAERQTEQFRENLMESYTQQDEQLKTVYGVSFPDGATELQYSDLKSYREMIADHPEQYNQNKDVIDRVFSDLYKILSEIGKLTITTRARQEVIDNNNVFITRDQMRHRLAGAALGGNEQDMARLTTLSHYGNELMDIMQHLLRGKALLPAVAPILERYQISPAKSSDGAAE